MTRRIRRALERLSITMDKNLPHVNKKLKRAGITRPDPVVYSVAKYYIALNQLADK